MYILGFILGITTLNYIIELDSDHLLNTELGYVGLATSNIVLIK